MTHHLIDGDNRDPETVLRDCANIVGMVSQLFFPDEAPKFIYDDHHGVMRVLNTVRDDLLKVIEHQSKCDTEAREVGIKVGYREGFSAAMARVKSERGDIVRQVRDIFSEAAPAGTAATGGTHADQ